MNADGSLIRVYPRSSAAIDSDLKGKADLQFQSPIVGVLRKAFSVNVAGHLIRAAEERRGYVTADRSGIRVVQHLARPHRKSLVVAVVRSRRSNQRTQTAP